MCLAQTGKTITGTVTDAGEPVIGANIIEKGTLNGTVTDFDGNFELTVDDNAVLVISYVGYQNQEIPVEGQSIFDIELAVEANVFDEIVVIGYGTEKKSVVTGSITSVKADDLEDKQVVRLESALQGRTSGVRVTTNSGQPGAGSVVRVRGTTTLGNSDPLYVVDGVIINGGIDFLNQGDIESIEVLKDAASASIYGTRGANGVVLVTTKKGYSGGIKVNYNGFYGTQRPWKKLSLLNSVEYATLMNEASIASGGGIIFDNPSEFAGQSTDWQDAVFHYDAPIQNHEISISGGSKTSTFHTSFSALDHPGIVSQDNSRFQRYSARFNSDHKIGSRVKIGNSIGYTRIKAVGVSENSEFGSPLGRAINLDPITPVYETDPEVLNSTVFTSFPVVKDENGVFGISPYVTSEVLNPLAALQVAQGSGNSDKIVGNLYAEVEIIDDLKYRASIGADLAYWGGENFNPIFYLNAANRNDITNYSRTQNKGLYWIFENTLTYTKSIGDHKLTGLVGASRDKNAGEGIGGGISDIPVDNIDDASLGFSTSVESQSYFGFEYDSRTTSFFGRLNYNFKEKYLITGTLRRDGSSKFGANNKFGNFPSVSAGWVVTEENFVRPNSVLNFLKLRASWGVNGSDRIGDFLFLSTVGTGANYTLGLNDILFVGTSPNSLSNPDLRWEETTQTNFGFDAVLFRNVDLIVDYFNKKSTGILAVLEVPAFVGFGSPTANIGEMDNRGVEVELGYGNDFKKWSLDISGNISYNENEVLFISEDKDFLPGQTFGPQGLEITRISVGQPIGNFFGYKTDGLFQNMNDINAHVNADGQPLQPLAAPGDIRFVDVDGDGDIDVDDRTTIGDATPTWTYGISLDVTYGAFDLSLFGQGVFGNDIFDATRRFDLQMANLRGDALGRWTGEGTSTDYPRLVMNDPNQNFSRSSDYYIENGAFFRIKNLQVGYTIPNNITSRINISKARFYVTANNLLTITDYSGFDPEIGSSFGVDRGIYPQARSFIVGANITFQHHNENN